MNSIESIAFARAGLLGNPSDAYGGKTISVAIKDFCANVKISESDRVVLNAGTEDRLDFDSVGQFTEHVHRSGYYGGVRLVKSAIIQYTKYCSGMNFPLDKPFAISYSSNIPRQVGMAGSSAIVVATLKGLCRWNQTAIKPHILASLALGAENELGITAGLQDRVIQAHNGLVYMDFSPDKMQLENGIEFGDYEFLSPDSLSNLFVAYAPDNAESTEVLHSDLRRKFESGNSLVIETLRQIADLAWQGKSAIQIADMAELSRLFDLNFDLRQKICKLHPFHVKMIEIARQAGASAKYCGSGGAIVGIYRDQSIWNSLSDSLCKIGCKVFRPQIATQTG